MKREELIKLGVPEELIDGVMALHGKGVEAAKKSTETAQAEIDGLKKQLEEAGKTIEGFKGMDIESIKKAAEDYKTQLETARKEAAEQVARLKFDHALDGALAGAKAKNAKAVKAMLDTEMLKFNDADGSIVGLEDQLKKVKESADYLFESDEQTPRIVAGGTSKSVSKVDPVTAIMRKAAGLPDKE